MLSLKIFLRTLILCIDFQTFVDQKLKYTIQKGTEGLPCSFSLTVLTLPWEAAIRINTETLLI